MSETAPCAESALRWGPARWGGVLNLGLAGAVASVLPVIGINTWLGVSDDRIHLLHARLALGEALPAPICATSYTRYALWLGVRNNPLTVIVAKNDYQPTMTHRRDHERAAVTTDFRLKKG